LQARICADAYKSVDDRPAQSDRFRVAQLVFPPFICCGMVDGQIVGCVKQ